MALSGMNNLSGAKIVNEAKIGIWALISVDGFEGFGEIIKIMKIVEVE